MKLQNLLCAFGIVCLTSISFTACSDNHQGQTGGSEVEQTYAYTADYVCPMHCKGSGSEKAGKCPECKMDYVVNTSKKGDNHNEHDHEGHDHSHEGHNH